MLKKTNFIKKKMDLSWYIKLNIMVMGFLFVVFMMKEVNSKSFKSKLDYIFSGAPTSVTRSSDRSSVTRSSRSVRIQVEPKERSIHTQIEPKERSIHTQVEPKESSIHTQIEPQKPIEKNIKDKPSKTKSP